MKFDLVRYRRLLDDVQMDGSGITRSRLPFQLEHFVVKSQENRMRQWYQLCIEADAKAQALTEASFGVRLKEIDIEEKSVPVDGFEGRRRAVEVERLRFELAVIRNGMIGAAKELFELVALAEREFSDLIGVEEDVLYLAHEREYWVQRLSHQAHLDICATGRVSAGNLDAIMKLPLDAQRECLLLSVKKVEAFKRLSGEVDKMLAIEEKCNGSRN